MSLTREEKVQRAETTVGQLFSKVASSELSVATVQPFVELAESLGLPERTVPPEEDKRLVFEFACMGLAVFDIRSRKYLMTESIFNPKFDPELHTSFMAAAYRAASQLLEAQGISQLRELRPQGKRTADKLQYREGKPLGGSHLQERSADYVRHMMRVIDSGGEDLVPAANDEFVYQVTELVDARLANRNAPVVSALKSVSQQVVSLATDLVDQDLSAE